MKYIGNISLTTKGDGYVRVYELDRQYGSVFVTHNNLNGALHGDNVEVEVASLDISPLEGVITAIIERAKKAHAGVIEYDRGNYYLVPDDKKMYTDIQVLDEDLLDANVGDKVVVRIKTWNDTSKCPLGEVIQVLGRPGDNDAEMLAYAYERGFNEDHDEKVIEEANAIKARGLEADAYEGRRDFRDVLTFTIDPIDAKDFDDAISFKPLDNGNYEVGIHIADVSHYVKPGSALDDEAVMRETSVYLVDRVIPMLPEVLSNDLCSLVEGQDRFVMSAVFELDNDGKVHNSWYGKSVIHSAKRFTYENAQESLDNKGIYYEELNILNNIAKKLFKERLNAGALILESEEVKFKLDDNGVPIDVYIKTRGDTHKLIEEYMLLANRFVSEYITKAQGEKAICVYRIHPDPDPEKMHELQLYIKSLGYNVHVNEDGLIPTHDLNDLLDKLKDKPEKDLLQMHITRSQQKATYSTQNVGHYGLAFDFYSHFTSPIRRYPDVLLHRLLMRVLNNDMPKEEERAYFDKLCAMASRREKDAADAERGSIKYKQVQYMGLRIGQEFEGIVSGVTKGGLYVEEKKSKCEGMIRMRDLGDDYYVFDENKGYVYGERNGQEWHVGDRVKIKVKSADLDNKTIDYVLVS